MRAGARLGADSADNRREERDVTSGTDKATFEWFVTPTLRGIDVTEQE